MQKIIDRILSLILVISIVTTLFGTGTLIAIAQQSLPATVDLTAAEDIALTTGYSWTKSSLTLTISDSITFTGASGPLFSLPAGANVSITAPVTISSGDYTAFAGAGALNITGGGNLTLSGSGKLIECTGALTVDSSVTLATTAPHGTALVSATGVGASASSFKLSNVAFPSASLFDNTDSLLLSTNTISLSPTESISTATDPPSAKPFTGAVSINGLDSPSWASDPNIEIHYSNDSFASNDVTSAPQAAGTYSVKAKYTAAGIPVWSNVVRYIVGPASVPPAAALSARTVITNIQSRLSDISLPSDANGVWSWQSPGSALSMPSSPYTSSVSAIFTPNPSFHSTPSVHSVILNYSKLALSDQYSDGVLLYRNSTSEVLPSAAQLAAVTGVMVSDLSVLWSCDNSSVARISGDKLVPRGVGLAELTADITKNELNGARNVPVASYSFLLLVFPSSTKDYTVNSASFISDILSGRGSGVYSLPSSGATLTGAQKARISAFADAAAYMHPSDKANLSDSAIEELDLILYRLSSAKSSFDLTVSSSVPKKIRFQGFDAVGLYAASGITSSGGPASILLSLNQLQPTNSYDYIFDLEFKTSSKKSSSYSTKKLESPIIVTIYMPDSFVNARNMRLRHELSGGGKEYIDFEYNRAHGSVSQSIVFRVESLSRFYIENASSSSSSSGSSNLDNPNAAPIHSGSSSGSSVTVVDPNRPGETDNPVTGGGTRPTPPPPPAPPTQSGSTGGSLNDFNNPKPTPTKPEPEKPNPPATAKPTPAKPSPPAETPTPPITEQPNIEQPVPEKRPEPFKIFAFENRDIILIIVIAAFVSSVVSGTILCIGNAKLRRRTSFLGSI